MKLLTNQKCLNADKMVLWNKEFFYLPQSQMHWMSYPTLHCCIHWWLCIILLNEQWRQANKFCASGQAMLCKPSLYIILCISCTHADSQYCIYFMMNRMAAGSMAFANSPSLICSSAHNLYLVAIIPLFFEWLNLSSRGFSKQDPSFRVPSKYQVLLAACIQLPVSWSRTITDLPKTNAISIKQMPCGPGILLYQKASRPGTTMVIHIPIQRDSLGSQTGAHV